MNRRLFVLTLIVVLFSTFFSLSSSGLATPSVVRAAGCTTISGTFTGLVVVPGIIYAYSPAPINVPFSTGDSISATWIGTVNFSPNLVTGGMDVFLISGFFGFPTASYTITVCSAGAGQVTTTNFTDGRLNSHDPWETAALYCEADGSVKVLRLAQPVWVLAFIATPAEIAKVPKHPTKHTIIKQVGSVALYRLVGGQLQVNSPGLNPVDGIYVFRFDDCPIP